MSGTDRRTPRLAALSGSPSPSPTQGDDAPAAKATSRQRRWTVLGGVAAVLVAVVGVTAYVQSPAHALHDPQHSLQQLDMLYLDEPAPGAPQLRLVWGRPAVVVFCATACALPELAGAQVVSSDDFALAEHYGLGQLGATGVALVDARGLVRYRSYDPRPDLHEAELQTLVDGLGKQG